MTKIYNYLQRIGVQESHRHARPEDEPNAVFYRVTYGDSDYFTNAPNFTYDGVLVVLDYNIAGDRDYFKTLRQIENKIQKYCARYGYTATTRAHSWNVSISIVKTSDVEKADTYYYYRDASRREADETAHRLYEAGRADEVNDAIRDIMTAYGKAYNERLKEATA